MLFRIYDLLRNNANGAPTPRQIIAFVNALGSLHRQWQHEIPLSTQAAFSLLMAKDNVNFIDRLRGSNFKGWIPEPLIRHLEPNWQKNMAALYYNVPAEHAFQVLLATPIANALRTSDLALLTSISGNPGFPQVLEAVFESQYGTDSPIESTELANSAIGLESLHLDRPEYQSCKKMLWLKMSRQQSWATVNVQLGKGLIAVSTLNPEEIITPLLRGLMSSLTSGKTESPDEDRIVGWCAAVDTAIPFFALDHEQLVASEFRVPGAPEDFIKVVFALTKLHSSAMKFVLPAAPRENIIKVLATQAESGNWSEDTDLAVAGLSTAQLGWDWLPLLQAIVRTLGKNEFDLDVTSKMARTLAMLLRKLRPDDPSAAYDGIETEIGLKAFGDLEEAGERTSAAALAVLIIASRYSLSPAPINYGATGYSYNRAPSLSKLSQEANQAKATLRDLLDKEETIAFSREVQEAALEIFDLRTWAAIANSESTRRSFVERLARTAFEAGNLNACLSAEMLVENLPLWKEGLGDKAFAMFITSLAATGELQQALSNREYDGAADELYLAVIKHGKNPIIEDLLKHALRAVDKDGWCEDLDNPGFRIPLVASLPDLELGLPFEEALFEVASDNFAENQQGPLLPYDSLTHSLTDEARGLFYSQLANIFSLGTGPFDLALSSWGGVLAAGLIQEGPERSLERMKASIASARPTELTWIAEVLIAWGTRAPKASSVRKALKSEWQRVLASDDTPQTAKAALDSFGKALGWTR